MTGVVAPRPHPQRVRRGLVISIALGMGIAVLTWRAGSSIPGVERAPPPGSAREQAQARASFEAARRLGAEFFAAIGAQRWGAAHALMAPPYRAARDADALAAACRASAALRASPSFSLRALREEGPPRPGVRARVARGALASLAGTTEAELDLAEERGRLSIERLRIGGLAVLEAPGPGGDRLPVISR